MSKLQLKVCFSPILTKTAKCLSACLSVFVFLLQVGDILTQVESVDEQWIFGVLHGKRGIVPKNYISLL